MPELESGLESERGDRLRRWRPYLGFTVNQDGKDIKPELQQRRWSGVDLTNRLKALNIPLVQFESLDRSA